MRVKRLLTAAFVALAVVALPAWSAVPGTIATFDSDEENFEESTAATTQVYIATGGNPDGHVELRKAIAIGDVIGTKDETSSDFLGNYAADGITGAGFDLNVGNFSLDSAQLRFRRDSLEDGWFFDFGAVAPNLNQWEPYDVFFDPTWSNGTALANGWEQEDGAPNFSTLMGDVGWIEVQVSSSGSLIVGVDNVRLLPEPGTIALLGAGLLIARLPRRRVNG